MHLGDLTWAAFPGDLSDDRVGRSENYCFLIKHVLPLVKHNAGQASKYTDGVHTVITPQQSVPARYIDPKAKNRSRFFCARA